MEFGRFVDFVCSTYKKNHVVFCGLGLVKQDEVAKTDTHVASSNCNLLSTLMSSKYQKLRKR